MKCRAVCGIRVWKTRFADAEEVFKTDYDFEAANEQAAKATCTRLVNAEPKMQDICGAVLLKVEGKLPEWWDEEWKSKDKPKWEAWGEIKRETYHKDPNAIYAECYRHSQLEFVTLDTKQASANVRAYIQLAWLEEKEEGI